MHLHIARVKRGDTTYEYAQLVQSFRRTDGVPSQRIIATLGALSQLEADNLRAALRASRAGDRVVVAPCVRPANAQVPDVVANLRYLDIAVAIELWREWQLDELMTELLPVGGDTVPPAAVVLALVIQRLVDPDSKLAATSWFPRSSLPELLDVLPSAFNNTRVHRALDALDGVGAAIMAKLPRRYQEKDGAFASLFLDVTDAAFVGHGPPQAERAKTKEGFIARKIGIVLLCNPRGYPVRWEVVPGRAHDSKTMLEMLRSISGLSWVGDAPVVCDRAMGKTATIVEMARLQLRFLTALTTVEFGSYSGDQLPHKALAGLHPTSSSDAKVEAEAVRSVTAAGMEQVDDNLYVMDLGIVERAGVDTAAPAAAPATAAHAMKLCRQMLELVSSNECRSFEDARRRVGLSNKGIGGKYRGLRHLTEDIQREVLAGRADGCTLDELLAIGRLPGQQQRAHFEQALTRPHRKPMHKTSVAKRTKLRAAPLRLRVVAYFNQERFVEKRYRAQTELAEIASFVDNLNSRLAASSGRRTRASIEAEVDRKLRSYDLLDTFKLRIEENVVGGRTRRTVSLTLDEDKWARRRRWDGFTLLVGHGELEHTAAQLCRLYRAKDTVEKDFHIVKSVLELRPVYHHTEGKVRAHVTLCMLALLLERTLRQRLRDHCTAETALEELKSCHLNQFSNTTLAYGLTRPTAAQQDILRQLGMLRLVDDAEVGERIHPRT